MVNEELPPEARDPNILEVTTSSGFPTAIVLVVGQADDENLRALARRTRQDLERLPAADQILAQGLNDPELAVLFDPAALAARGLNALELAQAASGWYQDVFAGRLRTDEGQWLVRSEGRSIDPETLTGMTLSNRDGGIVRFDDVARVAMSTSIPEQLVSFEGRPAVIAVGQQAGGQQYPGSDCRSERLTSSVRIRSWPTGGSVWCWPMTRPWIPAKPSA